ncbi:hypothetical protein [Nocardiopsis sp. YSL2]|uniref:hypothetical protein n=1 Tax=Nocardiopsis sp. YSL2 TaxID=2939492 RepID=UPI0026F43510|nr:hypothetical protein [Nocardiopsis sp. YSL2]
MSSLYTRILQHMKQGHPSGFDAEQYARLAADFIAPEVERLEADREAARKRADALESSLSEQQAWSDAMEKRLQTSAARVQQLLSEVDPDRLRALEEADRTLTALHGAHIGDPESAADRVILYRSTVECVLLDYHHSRGQLDDADPNLEELAHAYQEATGWTAAHEEGDA